jgi:hypothetical protein
MCSAIDVPDHPWVEEDGNRAALEGGAVFEPSRDPYRLARRDEVAGLGRLYVGTPSRAYSTW